MLKPAAPGNSWPIAVEQVHSVRRLPVVDVLSITSATTADSQFAATRGMATSPLGEAACVCWYPQP